MTTSFCPERLALARRRAGLTKRELSESAKLSVKSISSYETGHTTPQPETVEQLSVALGFPHSFFYRASSDRLQDAGVSFRSLSRMSARQRERALAGGELAVELAEWIAAKFVLPSADLPDLRGLAAEDAAMAVRERWALGDRPVGNMVHLLESRGVRVFSLAEDCVEVDAFSFWRNDEPFIFLNTLKSPEHSRFDAAHELGHLILHRHGSPAGREAEWEADSFASAFLMPRSSVLSHAPRHPTLTAIVTAKKYWKVSAAALTYRMHKCGLVSDWNYRSLWMQMQERGYRRSEPDSIQREMSQVLEKVLIALRRDGVTRGQLARNLGWPKSELNALTFGLILAAEPGAGAEDQGPDRTQQKNSLRLVR